MFQRWHEVRRVIPRARRDVAQLVLAVLLASTGIVGGMALVLHGAPAIT